ncbi:pyrin [Tachysurus vachellii]|uniref:pyrin n=1 Tax=Tachysurus vachellii TaxID=175792 RepID=UPI00296B345D|nr:pyrin [Tachysurus vachellii]
MSSIGFLLLNTLDELVKEDFERFKWSLTNNNAQGFEPISRCKLENAKQRDIVDLMVNQYEPPGAAKVTVQVLKQIGQNKLANDLEKKLKAEAQVEAAEGDGVSSSSSSSSQAAKVSVNISADSGSNISAPALSGTFNGPVNINYSSTSK